MQGTLLGNCFAAKLGRNVQFISKKSFHASAAALERPFRKRNKGNKHIIVHAAERPPEPSYVDFSSLGLKYKLITASPKFLVHKFKWSPPIRNTPGDDPASRGLPFFVERTATGNHLPVYTQYRNTKVVTELRRIKGDAFELKEDLEKVVGREVLVKPGKFVIDGSVANRVRIWLTALGF